MGDNNLIVKQLPDLRGLLDSKAEQRLYVGLRRIYEYIDQQIYQQKQEIASKLESSNTFIQKQTELLNGFATKLIGLPEANNPLAQLGGGTVVSVTAGGGLSGGTITQSGTVALIIGANNKIQKSDGTKLIDCTISDSGTVIDMNGIAKFDKTQNLIIVTMLSLPIADPGISGALWNNAGVVNVSP